MMTNEILPYNAMDTEGLNLAVAYVRVSTEGQVDKYGLLAQEEAIKAYAEMHGITVVKVFREEGKSGAYDMEERPALSECWDFMADYGITSCIIYELGRLARDLMVQETIIAMFKNKNYELLSTMEPDLMENDPMRKAFRQFRGIMNEFERSMITTRMRSGRVQKAKAGHHATGRIPLGYRSVSKNGKKTLEKVGDEMEIVKRVFTLRDVYSLSFQKIADKLNESGVRPKNWTIEKPTQFHTSTVQKIYKNPKYQGRTFLKENGVVIAEGTNDDLRVE